MIPPPPRSTLFPYTTLFRSQPVEPGRAAVVDPGQPRHRDHGDGSAGAERQQQTADRLDQAGGRAVLPGGEDRKSTRLNSSHITISYAVFCLKKKKKKKTHRVNKQYKTQKNTKYKQTKQYLLEYANHSLMNKTTVNRPATHIRLPIHNQCVNT